MRGEHVYRRTKFEKSACEVKTHATGMQRLTWSGGFVDRHLLSFQTPAELFFRSSHDAIVFSERERPRSAQMWQGGKLIQDGMLPERHVHVVPAGSEVKGWLGPGEPEILTVYLDPIVTRELLLRDSAGDFEFEPHFGPGTSMIWELASALRGEFETGGALAGPYVEALGQMMSVYASRHHARMTSDGQQRPGALDRTKLRLALTFMQDSMTSNPSLLEIADACGLSPYHFSRSFKIATGYSPFQWITQRKVSLAKDLLQSSNLTIGEIAQRYAFGSPSDFTRTFKKVVGLTPARYRGLVATSPDDAENSSN